MKPLTKRLQRILLPMGTFLTVGLIHFVWIGLFPEHDPAQDYWVTIPPTATPSWLTRYIEHGDYWLGLSYALSLAFAVIALRRYREERFCQARNLAIGSATFSGVLAIAGCYLLGCCGSPMLAVYISLIGAAFLPLVKPLVAAITLISILVGWWWMNRKSRSRTCCNPSNR